MAEVLRLLCLHCRELADVDPDAVQRGCPSCGNTGTPADLDDTVTLTITTHELRVLTIWASNYAESIKEQPGCEDSPKVVHGILDGIGQYTAAPLSLRQEISDVRAAFPCSQVAVYRDGETTDI